MTEENKEKSLNKRWTEVCTEIQKLQKEKSEIYEEWKRIGGTKRHFPISPSDVNKTYFDLFGNNITI